MTAPFLGVLWSLLEDIVTNPGGPSFAVPSDKLHGVLRPRLLVRPLPCVRRCVVHKLCRNDGDEHCRHQSQNNFDNPLLTPPELLLPTQLVFFSSGRNRHVHIEREVFLLIEHKRADVINRLSLPDLVELQGVFLTQ